MPRPRVKGTMILELLNTFFEIKKNKRRRGPIIITIIIVCFTICMCIYFTLCLCTHVYVFYVLCALCYILFNVKDDWPCFAFKKKG